MTVQPTTTMARLDDDVAQAIPNDPHDAARFLVSLSADRRKVSTIRVTATASATAYRMAGLDSPCMEKLKHSQTACAPRGDVYPRMSKP